MHDPGWTGRMSKKPEEINRRPRQLHLYEDTRPPQPILQNLEKQLVLPTLSVVPVLSSISKILFAWRGWKMGISHSKLLLPITWHCTAAHAVICYVSQLEILLIDNSHSELAWWRTSSGLACLCGDFYSARLLLSNAASNSSLESVLTRCRFLFRFILRTECCFRSELDLFW